MKDDNFSLSVTFPLHRTDIARQVAAVFTNIARDYDNSKPLVAGPKSEGVTESIFKAMDGYVQEQAGAETDDAADDTLLADMDLPDGGTLEIHKGTAVTLEGKGTTILDENRVARNPALCANAKDPFYKSGARKGQWKKAKNVTDLDYDTWYAAAPKHEATAPDTTQDEPAGKVDSSKAFGSQEPEEEGVLPPTNPGEYMAWVSERQTAGHLPQPMIDEAFKQTGVTMATMFSDDQAVGKLYNFLVRQGVPA